MADEISYTSKEDTVLAGDYAAPPSVCASVKLWTKRIRAARTHWDTDFKRMRANMEFVAGFQWQGQTEMDDDRYTNNMVLRLVKQKVASLYARNPRIVSERRKRLDFTMWDGRTESLQQAVAVSIAPEATPEDLIQAQALLADYTTGRQHRDLVDRVGQSLEIAYGWQLDNQVPSFKLLMKQLVRRVVITGVGYIRQNWVSTSISPTPSSSDSESTTLDRIKAAKEIVNRLNSKDFDLEDPDIVTLQSLLSSLGHMNEEGQAVSQDEIDGRLSYDCPPSTSVIIDPNCRAIRGFVGARWIAQEFLLTLPDLNAFFETRLTYDQGIKQYSVSGEADPVNATNPTDLSPDKDARACVWEVFDMHTRTRFFLCDGYDQYLLPPEPMEPHTKAFWPIFGLTFNDVEVEPGQQKASIFPPSDVQIVKGPQKEWNRTREGLRNQRKANAPKYLAVKGQLSDEDKENLKNALPNSVIEIECPPGTDVSKLVVPFNHAPVDPSLYDTSPLVQDMFLAVGNEEATRPAASNETATASTINEQSRIMATTSNVDDLDDLLSDMAEAGGEILLRELSLETVRRIAGRGAVWPEQTKEDFINTIYLTIVAASSGRPNRALELSNFQQIAPLLISAGVKPFFIVREALKRLDDRIDPEEAFSLGAPAEPNLVPAASPEPPRGRRAPSGQDMNPAGTVPQPRQVERPALPQQGQYNA